MSIIYRCKHNDIQLFQLISGFSNLCFYNEYIIFNDVNNYRIDYIHIPNDIKSQMNGDNKLTFIDVQLNTQTLIKDIDGVQCMYVQNEYFILTCSEHIEIYTLSQQNGTLSLTQISKITLPIKNFPIKCYVSSNMLILVSTFENKIFLYNNITADEITQQIHIASNTIKDIVSCDDQIYIITSHSIIKLNIDDLSKSQQHDIQLQGDIIIALVIEKQKQIIIFSDKRQMLIVSLENYSIVQTQQKITKTDPLYGAYIAEIEKIVIIGEGNEIIYLNTHQEKKDLQQEKRITQVKQDFYDTQFRTDGFIYGFSHNNSMLACRTSNFIYYWMIN